MAANGDGAAIRAATGADAHGIARVHIEAWRETYPGILPDRVLADMSIEARTRFWNNALDNLGTRTGVFVVDTDTGIQGFGLCGPERLGLRGYDGEFLGLYLMQAVQGRGLGQGLMRAMARSMHRWRARNASVWTLRDNRRARSFYEKLGGVYITERPLTFDGETVMEVAYGWSDLAGLIDQEVP